MSKKKTDHQNFLDSIVASPLILLYWLLRKLPERISRRICICFGKFARILRIRRKVIDYNLAQAFPEKSVEERILIRNKVYRNIGDFLGEWIKLPEIRSELCQRVTIENQDLLEDLLKQNKGLLMCSAHIGNWEIMASHVAQLNLEKVSIIRHKLNNQRLDKWFTDVHELMHFYDIIKGQSMMQIFRCLKRKEIVGMLVDQSGRGSGIWVPFFNRPSSFHRGPGVIISKTRCPAVTMFCVPDNATGWRIVLKELKVDLTGELEQDTKNVMSEYARELERIITQYPERYFWFHRRWKTKPPEDVLKQWESCSEL